MSTPKINPDAQYKVTLAEKLELFGQVHYPGHDLTLRGDVLQTVADKVATAVLVPGSEPGNA